MFFWCGKIFFIILNQLFVKPENKWEKKDDPRTKEQQQKLKSKKTHLEI